MSSKNLAYWHIPRQVYNFKVQLPFHIHVLSTASEFGKSRLEAKICTSMHHEFSRLYMKRVTCHVAQNIRLSPASLFKATRRVRLRRGSLPFMISQTDLGPRFSDGIWNKVRPEVPTDSASQIGYFTAIPDLVRATHYLKSES